MQAAPSKEKTPVVAFSLKKGQQQFIKKRAKSAALGVSGYLQILIDVDRTENTLGKYLAEQAQSMEVA